MTNCATVKGKRAVVYTYSFYKNGVRNGGTPTKVYTGKHVLSKNEDVNCLYYMGTGREWNRLLKINGVTRKNQKLFIKKQVNYFFDGIYLEQDLLKQEGLCIAQTKQKYKDLCVNAQKTDIKKYSKNDVLKTEIMDRIRNENRYISEAEVKNIYKRLYNKVYSFGKYHNWNCIRSFENDKNIAYNRTWGDIEKLMYQHLLNKRGIMPVVNKVA